MEQHDNLNKSAGLMELYRQKAEASGIDRELPKLPKLEDAAFQQHRRENIRVYAYANRITNQLLRYMEYSQAVFALFDQTGCLLKSYGNDTALSQLKLGGLERGTLWQFDQLGPNAVTVGLAEKKALASSGAEHYCLLLQKYAIYFAPIDLRESYPPYQPISLCGMALIVPVEARNDNFLMSVFAVANSILLQFHSQRMVYRHYESLGYGLVTLDINTYNDKITVFYHSRNIFEVLGIPPMDIYFREAGTFIDPEPRNADFWTIVKEQRQVRDYNVTLQLRGSKIGCIITTEPYGQPGLNVRGVQLIVTTQKEMSAQVSGKMGNSAVRTFEHIIGRSPCVKNAVQKGRLLSSTDSNVMLLGESGVGKDVFAQALHNASRRTVKPFIAVNCGALPRDLIASELFGYESGAFTGAKRQGNIGKFELANGGTIFLDEIGELPLDLQATLLRVVEQKQFMRLGGREQIDIDVKIISATNADISGLIAQNRFRADLYYRLSTMRLNIPPLRDRGDDVILLAEHFVRMISTRIGRSDVMRLSEEAKQLMLKLPWPGNVRELQNLMESIVQLYPEPLIRPDHILENINLNHAKYEYAPSEPSFPGTSVPPRRKLLTRADIIAALERCGGNRSDAARYLGIARKTLYRNMERLGME